jgi:DNA-binding LytR/AlgR family response regulator
MGNNEIFIKKGSSLVRIELKDIKYLESRGNYVTLVTKDELFTIHFTLAAIENQLPSEIFIRVHQSLILSKSMIRWIKENSLDLYFKDSLKSLPIDNSFRDSLLAKIKWMS